MTTPDRYQTGFQDATREVLARIIARIRREAATSGPTYRPKLLELARDIAAELDGEVTQTECPVKGCVGGAIIQHAPESISGAYRIISPKCEYCRGLGAVSPTRSASYDGPRK